MEESSIESQINNNNNNKNKKKFIWFKRLQYKETESHSVTREVLLIVAALVAAVTFQAGVNPPGEVWKVNDEENSYNHEAQLIPFYIFLIFNTFALSSSILVIISLTYKFPFHFEIWVATFSMLIAYGSSVFVATIEKFQYRYVLTSAIMPLMIRVLGEVFSWCGYCKSDSLE